MVTGDVPRWTVENAPTYQYISSSTQSDARRSHSELEHIHEELSRLRQNFEILSSTMDRVLNILLTEGQKAKVKSKMEFLEIGEKKDA